MTSELRSWYLSNLGIVQYVPKGEESAALAFHASPEEISNEAVLPTDVGSGDVDSGSVDYGEAHFEKGLESNSSHRAQVANVLELMGAQSIKPGAQSDLEVDSGLGSTSDSITDVKVINDESKVSGNKVSDHPSLSFRLACWHPCEDMLVFNQFLPGEQPDQSQSLLLSNILKSVGRLPNGLSAPELFDWPMDNAVGDSVDHSESGAKDMLSVFLDARIKKYGVLWVLLMGELPSMLLFPEEHLPESKPYPDLLGRIEEIAGGAQIIVVRSLQDMIEEPGFKAETWQTIRYLAE